MIKQVLTTFLISVGAGFLCQYVQTWAGSQYLNSFLQSNLVNLLVALLAVNSATMGIVLTKMRDLLDRHGGAEAFKKTRQHMLLSIKEQIALIVASIALLTINGSEKLSSFPDAKGLISTLLCAAFIYAMMNLYDVAKSVLIIIDYE